MFLTHILRFLRDLRRARRNFEELRTMSDHELADIGVNRSDIFSLSYGRKDF